MTLGADIKEVIDDVGVPITILRDAGNITGEHVKTKLNAQVTKPFIREFFGEAWLAYDTQAIAGDYIQVSDGRIFIIMNKTPKLFEGCVIRYNAVIYKCNVVGTIRRPSTSYVSYSTTTSWNTIKSNVNALITESLFGNELDQDDELGALGLSSNDMYIPNSLGVKVLDRFKISSNEYYQIETIKARRFENIDLVGLGEDNRGSDT